MSFIYDSDTSDSTDGAFENNDEAYVADDSLSEDSQPFANNATDSEDDLGLFFPIYCVITMV